MSWRTMRLVPATLACWICAFIVVNNPEQALVVVMLSAALGAGALVLSHRTQRPAASVWLPVMTVALAGVVGVSVHVALTQPGRAAASEAFRHVSQTAQVEALVVGKVEPRAGGAREFDAAARILDAVGSAHSGWVDVTVRVSGTQVTNAVDVGAVLRISGTSRPSQAGDRAVVQFEADSVVVQAPPSGVLGVTAHLRQALVQAAQGLPGGGGELIPGLAVGDTSAVSSATDAAMKNASLSHLTAVSGANCALVVGIAFGVAAGAGAGRGIRVAAGVVALAAFVTLVTPEPSVVRAAVMAGIAMLAVLLGRTGAGIAVLAASVLALLLCDPWLSTSLGFALSVAATAALLLLARPLAAAMERYLPRALALVLAVPLSAQLVCGPLLVLIDPTVPLWGVPANLLAAPAAPLATVLGLAACVSAPFPLVQSGLTALTWLPAAWIASVAEITAGLPLARIPWVEGVPGAVLLAAVGALLAVAIVGVGTSQRATRTRYVAAGVTAATLVVWAGSALATALFAQWSLPSGWSIIACDIGQGDALLVRSASALALIDTGPEPARLRACLDRVGVSQIDLLVLTHFDKDHAGGSSAVVGHVDTVLHGPAGEEVDRQLLGELAHAGATLVSAEAGMTGRLGGAAWTVYWPRAANPFPPGNDSSVAIAIEGGGVPRALFLGDLPAEPQRMLSSAVSGTFDVVKVSHHGSADQDPGLYEKIAARVALIGVGVDNTYGHPTDAALALVRASAVGRTDVHGMLAVVGEGDALSLWQEHKADVGGGR